MVKSPEVLLTILYPAIPPTAKLEKVQQSLYDISLNK